MAIGGMPSRPALLIRINDKDGCYGWGEVWANFPPRAHLHKAHIIEDVIAPKLQTMQFSDPYEFQQALRQQLSTYFLHVGQLQVFEHILAGIDIALWDLALRKQGVTMIEHAGGSLKQAPCYASSINADELDSKIPQAITSGQTHFKIKIGFQSDGGCTLIERAGALCPENAQIMIDSNQSWELAQAVDALQSLQSYPLFFAEEPLRANAPLSDWEALAKATSIPLAGGENIYGVDNFIQMANAGLSVLQPDVAKWGGVSGALAVAESAPDGALVWPHFMGTAIGQMASLAVTAVIGGDSVCELDVNTNPLRTELCGDVMSVSEGSVKLNPHPGLVVEPLTEKLNEFGLVT